GVQTCALPILRRRCPGTSRPGRRTAREREQGNLSRLRRTCRHRLTHRLSDWKGTKTYPGRMPADTSTTTAAGSAPAQAAPDLRLQVAPGASLPPRAHTDDAGLDLASAEDLEIPPGGRALVDTGLAVALPPGTVGMVCPRSGLAAKHGITVLNGPGIVDAGYRGPVKVALHNTDP